mmetsp:Transcript_58216/g.101940  ORF Transcript_58216/g.101940 Transcript_58216/m.101940 type:complete len:176 (+) Transcript_58216:91-618(+)
MMRQSQGSKSLAGGTGLQGVYGQRMYHKLTKAENDIIEVAFNSFSEDTHVITSQDLRKAFSSIGDEHNFQDVQLLIDDIDENGDGKIDMVEFRHIMTRKFLGEDDDSSFMHAFEMLDENKDGYIPLVELRKILMEEGQTPLSELEVDELMMFADLDADGLIDYRSFLRWLEQATF